MFRNCGQFCILLEDVNLELLLFAFIELVLYNTVLLLSVNKHNKYHKI